LRLVPEHDVLIQWADCDFKAYQTYLDRGWTGFLNELTPSDIFDDTKETHYREFLLAHLFEICRREEEHKKNGVVGKLIKHRIILFSLTNQLTGTRNEYLMPNVFKDEQTLTRNQWIVNGVPVDKAPSPEELRTIASCSSPADTHTRMRWVLQGKANTCSSL
jgi:hypothetical protein